MFVRHKGYLAGACFILFTLIIVIGSLSRGGRGAEGNWAGRWKSHTTKNCPDNLSWLSSLNIAYPVQYARRDIVIRPDRTLRRESVTKVDEVLFPEFQTIDLSKDSAVQLKHCKDPVNLGVPSFQHEPVDASHIIFGISTTLERLEKSIPALLRWLPHTQARLIVIVIEAEQYDEVEAEAADPTRKAELQATMRKMGMDATLVEPLILQDTFSEKYFSLVKIMYSFRDEKTSWVATIDDDTFFPSMPALLAMLGKYDPDQKFYVGALSEDWWSVTHYGLMGFGGAGIFLSRALAEVLDQNYQVCKETSHTSAGDIRILQCIYAVTTTKLSNERDLHQIDVWGDLSGILESGRMPLSFHHWKAGAASDKGYDLPTMHLVSDVCRDCFLQRWWFSKDVLLTNGFSVATYPTKGLEKANLDYMEETWDGNRQVEDSFNRGVEHSLGPTRPKLALDEEKIQYKLIASSAIDGGVRQAYLHQGFSGDMDAVLELFWTEGKG